MDNLLTLGDLREVMGISRIAVQQRRRAGKLPEGTPLNQRTVVFELPDVVDWIGRELALPRPPKWLQRLGRDIGAREGASVGVQP